MCKYLNLKQTKIYKQLKLVKTRILFLVSFLAEKYFCEVTLYIFSYTYPLFCVIKPHFVCLIRPKYFTSHRYKFFRTI